MRTFLLSLFIIFDSTFLKPSFTSHIYKIRYRCWYTSMRRRQLSSLLSQLIPWPLTPSGQHSQVQNRRRRIVESGFMTRIVNGLITPCLRDWWLLLPNGFMTFFRMYRNKIWQKIILLAEDLSNWTMTIQMHHLHHMPWFDVRNYIGLFVCFQFLK